MYLAQTSQYRIPPAAGRTPSILLALAMHGLLAVMLLLGLNWQSRPPEVVNAELWSALPQIAAPTPTPTPPQKAVELPPPPKPIAVEVPVPTPKADIVVKEETPKKAPPLPPEPLPPPKVEAKPEPKPQPKPEVKAPPAPPSALQYIQSQVAASTGTSTQTSGPKGSNGYIQALQTKIRSNTIFAGQAEDSGNPTVVVEIEQLPTGEVTSSKILSSSGLPAFDRAVLSGIEKSSPLPKNEQGRVVTPVQLTYKLYPEK